MTEEKIIDKLNKIKRMADSAKKIGNEEEAQAFATMLQRLLAKHKLDMTDIQYDEHIKEEPVGEYECGGGPMRTHDGRVVYKDFPDVEITSKRTEWVESLAGVIAAAHSCAIMVASHTSRVWFVGHKSNCQIVEYLFVTMQRAAESISHKEYKKFRAQCRAEDNGGGAYLYRTHGFKASFLTAFIMRLAARFEEEKKKIVDEFNATHAGSSTALVRVNKEALAVRQYLDKRAEEKKTKPAASLRGQREGNSEGYARGRAFADSIRLDANAVKAGQPNKQHNLGDGK